MNTKVSDRLNLEDDPLLADTDSDGKDDDEESFWWDDQIEWPRNPEPQFVVIELTGYTPASLNYGNIWNIDSLYDGGHADGWSLQVSMNSAPKNNHFNLHEKSPAVHEAGRDF